MAYLNAQERQALHDELMGMNFGKATGKLRGIDREGRMAYYRNAQQTGKLMTRYELPGLGTRVTLIEVLTKGGADSSKRLKTKYDLGEVVVEPTADNRT